MKVPVISTILATAILTHTAVYGQVPDYLAHTADFDFVAVMITSARSCENFGIQVDDDGIEAFAKDAITDAVKDGVAVHVAEQMFVSELEEESDKQAYIVASFKEGAAGSGSANAELKEFLAYWRDRCADLIHDPRSAPFFKIAE